MTTVGVVRIPSFSGALMRTAREGRSWSQGRLAALLNVPVSNVGAWERGLRSPEPSTLIAISAALDVPPAALLDLPRSSWTLNELRAVTGINQKDTAQALELTQVRLSHIESAYVPVPPALLPAMARQYQSTGQEVTACWERTRRQLDPAYQSAPTAPEGEDL